MQFSSTALTFRKSFDIVSIFSYLDQQELIISDKDRVDNEVFSLVNAYATNVAQGEVI
jgi:hypothetical protein